MFINIASLQREGTLNCSIPTINPYFITPNNTVADPFMAFKNRTNRLDDKTKSHVAGDVVLSTLGVLPMVRRDESVPDKVEQGNLIGAGVQVAVGLANLPGDMREVMRAGDEVKKIFTKGVLPSAKDYKGQHAMTMLDGTLLEKLKRFKWLESLDKPFAYILNLKFNSDFSVRQHAVSAF
jgi:hypothetical protein